MNKNKATVYPIGLEMLVIGTNCGIQIAKGIIIESRLSNGIPLIIIRGRSSGGFFSKQRCGCGQCLTPLQPTAKVLFDV